MILGIAAFMIVAGIVVLIDYYSENNQEEPRSDYMDKFAMPERISDARCNPYANNTETTINITSDDQ